MRDKLNALLLFLPSSRTIAENVTAQENLLLEMHGQSILGLQKALAVFVDCRLCGKDLDEARKRLAELQDVQQALLLVSKGSSVKVLAAALEQARAKQLNGFLCLDAVVARLKTLLRHSKDVFAASQSGDINQIPASLTAAEGA